jgi:hypothetical protein
MSRSRLRRVALTGAAVIVIAAALVALIAVLRGSFSDTDGRILATLGATLLAGGVAAVGAALLDRGDAPTLSRITFTLAPIGFVLLAFAIWSFAFESEGETAGRLGWTGALILLWALATAGARVMATTAGAIRLAAATGLLAAIAVGLTLVPIWRDEADETFAKLLGASWILMAVGLLLTPILERRAGTDDATHRIIATLASVDLLAVGERELRPDDIVVSPRLRRDETLVLRRSGPMAQ